jgi:hypothetical protein
MDTNIESTHKLLKVLGSQKILNSCIDRYYR